MIEKTLRDLMRDSVNVSDRVDGKIYVDSAPLNTKPEYVILTNVTDTHTYSLANEVDARFSVIQVDCYSTNSYRARTLFETVRNLISGMQDLTNGIQACYISGGLGSLPKAPQDSSDQWDYRYSKDFTVIHVTDVPTHT